MIGRRSAATLEQASASKRYLRSSKKQKGAAVMCHSTYRTDAADHKAKEARKAQAAFDRRNEAIESLRKDVEQREPTRHERAPAKETVPAE